MDDSYSESDEDDGVPFHDRDYSTEFSITMEWHEWNRIYTLIAQGMDKKRDDDWPDEELEEDRQIRQKLSREIGDASPGNGMDDWPDSMKRAWDESVIETMKSIREENDEHHD